MSEKCGAPTTNGGPCQNDADSCPWHNTDDPPDTGRPSKISKKTVDQITADIAEGKSDTTAFELANLDPKTKYNWLDKAGDNPPEDPEFEENPYAYFFRRYTHARGLGANYYFETIIELAEEQGDHRFLASLMKQRYPDRWGDTETGVEATEINVSSDVVEITEDDIQH